MPNRRASLCRSRAGLRPADRVAEELSHVTTNQGATVNWAAVNSDVRNDTASVNSAGATFPLTRRVFVRSGFLSVSGGPKGTRTPQLQPRQALASIAKESREYCYEEGSFRGARRNSSKSAANPVNARHREISRRAFGVFGQCREGFPTIRPAWRRSPFRERSTRVRKEP
jgi:hypothetical protein